MARKIQSCVSSIQHNPRTQVHTSLCSGLGFCLNLWSPVTSSLPAPDPLSVFPHPLPLRAPGPGPAGFLWARKPTWPPIQQTERCRPYPGTDRVRRSCSTSPPRPPACSTPGALRGNTLPTHPLVAAVPSVPWGPPENPPKSTA